MHPVKWFCSLDLKRASLVSKLQFIAKKQEKNLAFFFFAGMDQSIM
jgi:hypothetical protein